MQSELVNGCKVLLFNKVCCPRAEVQQGGAGSLQVGYSPHGLTTGIDFLDRAVVWGISSSQSESCRMSCRLSSHTVCCGVVVQMQILSYLMTSCCSDVGR